MPSNNRVFYACQALAIAKTGTGLVSPSGEIMRGVQSVGISTNFTLEQVFEYGQVALYANIEDLPEIEVTIEKVIDGEKLLYLQAVGNSGKTDVVTASTKICDVFLAIYSDAAAAVAATTPYNIVMCSGMTVSSVGYQYPIDGNATESLTLTGTDKFWNGTHAGLITIGGPSGQYGSPNTGLDGTDTPVSGIVRRAKVDILNSTLPAEVSSPGQGNSATEKSRNKRIQSISVNADFGRENLLEQGRLGPYFKATTFPFEVTCEFEVLSTSGDLVSASGYGTNLTDRTIVLKDDAGTVIDLGTTNKLASISMAGGDTGGGNQTITYSYSTFNFLKVNGGGSYWD